MMMKGTAIIELMSLRIAHEQYLQESRAFLPQEYHLGTMIFGVELSGEGLDGSGYLVRQSLRAGSDMFPYGVQFRGKPLDTHPVSVTNSV